MNVTHGIRIHLRAHALLFAVTAFIGAMVGVERSVVPLLAEEEFGVESAAVALSFIASFGAVKAVANLVAGRLADRIGRRRVLIAGWLLGLPVPLLVIIAPSWPWVVAANLLLGANQGLAWTMTITMMGDLAGSRRRGLAFGANEFAGYVGIAVSAAAAAALAAASGLRPAPFVLAAAAGLLGLALSVGSPETRATAGEPDSTDRRAQARAAVDEVAISPGSAEHRPDGDLRPGRTADPPGAPGPRRSLVVCGQAGLVTKIIDAGVWGAVPLLLADRGLSLPDIGLVAAAYPLVWGIAQPFTGALGDAVGRPPLIVAGMAGQGAGVALLLAAGSPPVALLAAVVLGVATALAYPTLLSLVADRAPSPRRASLLGLYRFWRDLGFVAGALGIGSLADLAGLPVALGAAAALAAASAVVAGIGLRDSRPRRSTPPPRVAEPASPSPAPRV